MNRKSSSNRSSAPEIFAGIFILVCSSVPFFGFCNVFSTDGFMGIFWQGFITSAAIAVGVPIAMKVNRQNREEEDLKKQSELCKLMHKAIQENIKRIDLSLPNFLDGKTPPLEPYSDYRFHPEWHRLFALIPDQVLFERISTFDKYVMRLEKRIERLDSSSSNFSNDYESLANHTIGAKQLGQIRAATKLSGWDDMTLETNGGLNRGFIRCLGVLEKFMEANKIELNKNWNPNRITAVYGFKPKP